MEPLPRPDGTPPLQFYDPASVGELLKGKRKTRPVKACFPCRHRKVRCDGRSPCKSCIVRNHADLCRVSGPPLVHGSSQEGSRATRHGLSASLRGPGAHQFPPPAKAASPLLNLTSSAAAMEDLDATIDRLVTIEREISSLKAKLIKKRDANPSIMPVAGSALPPPQSHSPSSPLRREAASQAIPAAPVTSLGTHFVEDSTGATIFLGSYSDPPLALGCHRAGDGGIGVAILEQLMPRAYPFTDIWRPAVRDEGACQALPEDSDVLSVSLFGFLEQRAAVKRGDASYDDVDAPWLALLFAVLALGVQFSDDAIQERDLRSKVFVCSVFQLLWMSNVFHNTEMNHIQAMTHRTFPAQQPGFEQCFHDFGPLSAKAILVGARLARHISVDDLRPTTYAHQSPLSNTELVHFSRIFSRIEQVLRSAAPYLVQKSCCRRLSEHLERLALRIHTGYVVCRFFRNYLQNAPNESLLDHEAAAIRYKLAQECAWKASGVVEAFLDMYRFLSVVCRNWAFVHNVVSCAIFLDMVATHVGREKVDDLVGRFMAVLEKEDKASEWHDADTNKRHYGPYSRALRALKETLGRSQEQNGDHGRVDRQVERCQFR
ncbi:hypothetical protein M011DRAFT_508173 [Sporormia fimetaria CBS 119925]|uniref:Zn(2)-C6 fungal-type domain-containing protein n=1 Tax=Sporormia fimetaria CBS 119925 TaxID=1340428 RepID=A0A6A6V1Q8_9PLEO|nr:hypothetical protein M011DRAFT_508173 [Sporormia fimetaria CBS 119925]